MNKENLLILSDFLRDEIAPQVERGDKKFDMGEFTENGNTSSTEPEIICGTVACALGYAPLRFKPERSDYRYGKFFYDRFSSRVFGVCAVEGSYAWRWCFNAQWARIDNTVLGAAARIRWLVENGLPENWQDQLSGDAPLCYLGDDK